VGNNLCAVLAPEPGAADVIRMGMAQDDMCQWIACNFLHELDLLRCLYGNAGIEQDIARCCLDQVSVGDAGCLVDTVVQLKDEAGKNQGRYNFKDDIVQILRIRKFKLRIWIKRNINPIIIR